MQRIVEPLSSTTDMLGSRSAMQSIGCNIRRSTACAQLGRDLRTKTTAISATINRSPQPLLAPELYFHLTMDYDILRHCGVEIGKRDFLGAIPMKIT
jgi:Domain of unknown function (DUF1993)